MIEIPNYSVETAKDYLIQSANSLILTSPEIQQYCLSAIEEIDTFNGPASTKHHHVYAGGLLIHTAEVTSYAVSLGITLRIADYKELLAASILHDHMKIKDYQWNKGSNEWERTWHSDHIYHIAEGYAQFTAAMKDHPERAKIDRIGHMILSHHGRPEWGSAISPKTQEAYILHMADVFSVNFGPGRNKPNVG